MLHFVVLRVGVVLVSSDFVNRRGALRIFVVPGARAARANRGCAQLAISVHDCSTRCAMLGRSRDAPNFHSFPQLVTLRVPLTSITKLLL